MAGGKSSSSKSGGAHSDHKFTVGDVVLAKIKGFPAWPGVLVDGDQVPKAVRAEKPKDKFIIRFFPKADYHFPGPRDLTLLTPEQCRAYASDSHRKDGELKEGYRIAADPEEWIRDTDETVRSAEAAREEEELEQEENMDQLEEEEEEDEEDAKPTSGKKRSAAPTSKNSKAKKAKKEPAKSSNSNARKSASAAATPAATSAHHSHGDEDGAEGELDEATKRVRGWRHSLQRAFLPKDREPTEKDVEGQDLVFSTVEKADITVDQLRATKIGKVLRKIVGMKEIPLDGHFNFRSRSEALLARWAQVQSANGNGNGSGGEVKAEAPTTSTLTETKKSTPPQNDSNGAGGDGGVVAAAAEGDGTSVDVGDLTEVKEDSAL